MSDPRFLSEHGLQTLVNKLKNDYATKAAVSTDIANAIANVTQFKYRIVESLPLTGEDGVLYLLINSGSEPNAHNEYIWISNKYEMVGSAEVDLSDYLKTAKLQGDGTYVVANIDDSTGNVTISLSASTVASLDKADNSVQKDDVIPDADILAMFNPIFNAIVVGFYKAPLHDESIENPIEDNEIVSDYEITVGSASGNGDIITVPIEFSGTDLKEHTNDSNEVGYWMGVAFPESVLISNYDVKYYSGFGEYVAPTNSLDWVSLASTDFVENEDVATTGTYHLFYREVGQAKENNDKAFVALQYSDGGVTVKTVVYEYDYSNVSLAE